MLSPLPKQINRIAFVNMDGQVCTIAPDGTALRRLTLPGNIHQFPAWSPNGQHIAAIGSNQAGTGIFRLSDGIAPNGQELYYSRFEPPFYLMWSPDSQRLTFLTPYARGGLALRLVPLNAQADRLITIGQPCFWDWMPDSEQLLYHVGVGSPNAQMAFTAPFAETDMPDLDRPGLFQAPAIAAEGRHWAFGMVDQHGNSRLVIESNAGERYTTLHHGSVAFGWQPQGDNLAFISPEIDAQRFYGPLRLMQATTGRVETLVEATVLAFFWSPDGEKIAYFEISRTLPPTPITPPTQSVNGNGVYHTNGASPTSESAPPRDEETLRLSLSLLELKSRRTRLLTTFEPSPLFVNQFLPFFDQYSRSHRLWSPASDAFLLHQLKNDLEHVALVPIDGSAPRLLAEGTMAFWSWQ